MLACLPSQLKQHLQTTLACTVLCRLTDRLHSAFNVSNCGSANRTSGKVVCSFAFPSWNACTFGTIGLRVSFPAFSKDALDHHQYQRWCHGMQPEDRFGWVFAEDQTLALTFSFHAVACKKV
jgi:hypothetical protein